MGLLYSCVSCFSWIVFLTLDKYDPRNTQTTRINERSSLFLLKMLFNLRQARQHRFSDDLHTSRRHLVNRVISTMPMWVTIQLYYVDCIYSRLQKRFMIVTTHTFITINKDLFMA